MRMVKIEAYVQPFRLEAIKAALDNLDVEGVSYCHVMDCSGRLGLKLFYRGSEYGVDSPRLKVEILVSLADTEDVIEAVSEAAQTGISSDEGLLVMSEVYDAVRISKGRRVHVAP